QRSERRDDEEERAREAVHERRSWQATSEHRGRAGPGGTRLARDLESAEPVVRELPEREGAEDRIGERARRARVAGRVEPTARPTGDEHPPALGEPRLESEDDARDPGAHPGLVLPE